MRLVFAAQIVIAIIFMLVVLVQARGGGVGGIFGGWGSSTFRTRRGIEKTLFRFTIVLMVVLVIISMISVRLA